jgi:hypothetical protein
VNIRALESVVQMAAEYRLPQGELKPCVAYILDGNLGAAARHEAAFILGLECRRMGLTEERALGVVRAWARRIDYNPRTAASSAAAAWKRKANGDFKYHAPGRTKGRVATAVLDPICRDVGCPEQCPPLQRTRRPSGRGDEMLLHEYGWTQLLQRRRMLGALQTYRAICVREAELEWVPGRPFHVTHQQLAERAVHGDKKAVARHLRLLADLGLIQYEAGSGAPGARRASVVARVVPVPRPGAPGVTTAIRAGGVGTPDIGGASSCKDGEL